MIGGVVGVLTGWVLCAVLDWSPWCTLGLGLAGAVGDVLIRLGFGGAVVQALAAIADVFEDD